MIRLILSVTEVEHDMTSFECSEYVVGELPDMCTNYNASQLPTTTSNESDYNNSYTDGLICIFQSEDDITSKVFKILIYIMYIAVFIAALVGNGLVCAVVHIMPRMKTVTNYFIVNLAVGDILMTLFCVPFTFVPMLLLRYWPFGAFMCKFVNFCQAASVLVSAYTLVAISVDRYIIIMHPLKPRLEKSTAKKVMISVWIVALITASPIPVMCKLQKPSLWYKACNVDICSEQWPIPGQASQYTYALLLLQFVLPLSVLVFTYVRIAHSVWTGRMPGEAQQARDSRMKNSKRKMVKMMLAVVTVFIICWLPLNVFIVLWMTHIDDEEWSKWPGMPYVWFACHWLAMFHSCSNPIIYFYMNERYRRGFKEILSGLLCLKKKNSQRSNVCDGIPLSEIAGVELMGQQGLKGCRCQANVEAANCTKCASCTSLQRQRGEFLTPSIQAPSMRSTFF